MTGRALIVQGDALRLPLPDESVDLVVTSPPYFALRAYSAGSGEIGSEPTPQEYLEALWAATAEMARVLKPTGSMFIDLGDKYAGGGGQWEKDDRPDGGPGHGPRRIGKTTTSGATWGMPPKSLMLLPERYRVGCVDQTSDYYRGQFYQQLSNDLIDGDVTPERARQLAAEFEASPKSKGLGLIARAVICWNKPNGLPESVTDRVRRSHEDWVHLVKQPRYYAATDEIREPHIKQNWENRSSYPPESSSGYLLENGKRVSKGDAGLPLHPLGKLPGSVWTIPSEPLTLPGYFITQDGQLQDFLAPSRGRPRPRTNGNGHGLFDPDPFAELVGGEDAGAWRWLRATGVNASPWPQQDGGLQLRTAASHYAAFPSRWPEQLIKAFSPPGICLDCGQGRTPVVERGEYEQAGHGGNYAATPYDPDGYAHGVKHGHGASSLRLAREARILGYACACTPHTNHPGSGNGTTRRDYSPGLRDNNAQGTYGRHQAGEYQPVGPWWEYHLDGWRPPPTRPAVVLDSFGGTGTVAMVARALDRIGISIDLSMPYCRAARWRVHHDANKAISRTWTERQGQLL